MAGKFDELPDYGIEETRTGLANYSHAQRKQKAGFVTFKDYTGMLADRPEKFSPAQVNYHDAEGTERCGTCFHFFRQAGGAQRTVCEILRDGDKDIEPTSVCMFFTVDLENYPLLEGSKNSNTNS